MGFNKLVMEKEKYKILGKIVSRDYMKTRCFKYKVLDKDCCKKHCKSNIC